jgi:uncharacterized tellurite resistance protein B-like protein
MFGTFLKSLLAPAPAPLTKEDAQLALCALLVRVARSDENYAPSEIAQIDKVMMTRYGFDSARAAQLRKSAETLEQEAPDTVRFTRALKDAVPYDDRIGVIEALWSIALADGARDAYEDAVIRLVANLLGITDVESATARQHVMK